MVLSTVEVRSDQVLVQNRTKSSRQLQEYVQLELPKHCDFAASICRPGRHDVWKILLLALRDRNSIEYINSIPLVPQAFPPGHSLFFRSFSLAMFFPPLNSDLADGLGNTLA